MKYVIEYTRFFESVKAPNILYHGSVFKFNEFKNTTTFFTASEKFATDYAIQKSQEGEMDADLYLYICEVNAELFDPMDEKSMDALMEKLPDKILVSSGFGAAYISKEKIPDSLLGKGYTDPDPVLLNASVGERLTYNGGRIMVLDKNQNYITIMDYWLVDAYHEASTASKYNFYVYPKLNHDHKIYRDLFKEYHDFMGRRPQLAELEKEEKEKAIKFLRKGEEKLYKALISDEKSKKISLHRVHYDDQDTWSFFESDSVTDVIKDLGYDGYIARERNEKTYAIFDPESCVKIMDIKRIR